MPDFSPEYKHKIKMYLCDDPEVPGYIRECQYVGIWNVQEKNIQKLHLAVPFLGGGYGSFGHYYGIIYKGNFDRFKKYASPGGQASIFNFA